MEKKTKIILFTGLAVTTIGLLYLKIRMNQKQGEALLEALNKSFTENDISKGGDEAIKAIGATKLYKDKIAVGKYFGSIVTDKKLSAEFDKVYGNLWESMKGVGTNQDKFYSAFFQIKNKNTMAYIDKMFKAQFGEGLFEWMKGEKHLYNSVYGKFSDKTNGPLSTIPFINGYWEPTIAKYLTLLPDYTQLK